MIKGQSDLSLRRRPASVSDGHCGGNNKTGNILFGCTGSSSLMMLVTTFSNVKKGVADGKSNQ